MSVNIVIADDDRSTRLILRMLLRENYFDVVGEAGDGAKAVELCASLRPDIVFLDIDMPKMNGHPPLSASGKKTRPEASS